MKNNKLTYESPVMEYISETLYCVLCSSETTGTGNEIMGEDNSLDGIY